MARGSSSSPPWGPLQPRVLVVVRVGLDVMLDKENLGGILKPLKAKNTANTDTEVAFIEGARHAVDLEKPEMPWNENL